MRKPILTVIILLSLFLFSCGKAMLEDSESSFDGRTRTGWAGEKEESGMSETTKGEGMNFTAKASAVSRSDLGGMDDAAREMPSVPDATAVAPQPVSDGSSGDKRIFTGYQKLRVADVEETKSAITQLTNDAGGYVESLYSASMVLRIPKARFSEIFTHILGMGEVLNKSIESFDVSEYFQDLSLRLDIAVKSRARLYALLEQSRDVKERLKILKEINRLSEEIENIRLRLESLKQLIAYSRITVELVPRLAGNDAAARDSIPFGWIAGLDAFFVSLPKLDGSVDIELPEDFAVFSSSDYYHAETPDGTVVRIGTVRNFPEGDNDFWQQALEFHLGPLYKSVEKTGLGTFSGVLLPSRDRDPYYYLVAVRVKKNKIQVLEILFPDKSKKESLYDDLVQRIQEVE
ncbi:MAG: DUF4349 domain-containing protein [Spirochaetales bacterium]|nr:DUF4349 domain-containing protein [Spirochaetales bacterium]